MKTKIISLIVCLAMPCGLFIGCSKHEAVTQNDYRNTYELISSFEGIPYRMIMDEDEPFFNRLRDFKNLLYDSSELEFYAYTDNAVELKADYIPETCIVGHDTDYVERGRFDDDGKTVFIAQSIQVSENFFSLFPLKITEGRVFEPADFECQITSSIPVILGNTYLDVYSIGDTFEGKYLSSEYQTFKVIGFADTESRFYLAENNKMESYDDYVIMPVTGIGDDSSSFARGYLFRHLCGFVTPSSDRNSALNTIQKLLNEAGLEDLYYVFDMSEMSLKEKMDQ